MADETPVPETLESIAARLTALGKSLDERFAKVDERFERIDERFEKMDERFEKMDERFERIDGRFTKIDDRFDELAKTMDRRFAETNAQLGMKIEAVDAKVALAYDGILGLLEAKRENDTEHATFRKHLAGHELRLVALERRETLQK